MADPKISTVAHFGQSPNIDADVDTPSTAVDTQAPPSPARTARESGSDEQRRSKDEDLAPLERTETHVKELWKFRLRGAEDDLPQ